MTKLCKLNILLQQHMCQGSKSIHIHTNDCSACIWESPVTSVHHCVTKSKALTTHCRHEALCTTLEGWGVDGKMPKHSAKDENSSSSWKHTNEKTAGEIALCAFYELSVIHAEVGGQI